MLSIGGGYSQINLPVDGIDTILNLPNGNIVAASSSATYLFNGSTGAMISTLTGASGPLGTQLLLLSNGNYLIEHPSWNGNRGAVTWGSATKGVSGVISAENSLVGSEAGDFVGEQKATNSKTERISSTVALVNGNYAVGSPNWNGGEGAATWGNGSTGTSGTISINNSIVGSQTSDGVGTDIIPLTNGNFVILSPNWDGHKGAVTWGSGALGVSGIVSASNSLVGSESGDKIAGDEILANPFSAPIAGGVISLKNGNYVVSSPSWHGGSGAATWGSGSAGIFGVVSSDNSLVGNRGGDTTLFTDGDSVSANVVALDNGNYVVGSPLWNSEVGAATWGDGLIGVTGVISSSNSLIGTIDNHNVRNQGDQIGKVITPLTNGNYVVASPTWNHDAGAATWADGATGMIGFVSSENSLVGMVNDSIGESVVPLTNGNYVVLSTSGNGGGGSATWGNGASGTVGFVTSANSLVGSGSFGAIGEQGGIVPLTNGNYVVVSPFWDSSRGAVTWGDGKTGTVGVVSADNSLIGNTNDTVGVAGVVPLSNGNYVFGSPDWSGNRGAVTWGNGAAGSFGIVSSINSIVGSSAGDRVGYLSGNNATIFPLTNGNYVVTDSLWNSGKGAVTWGDGDNGSSGVVSADNSIVGSIGTPSQQDRIGNQFIRFSNGSYVVASASWANSRGAVTWAPGDSPTGATVGPDNSYVGNTGGINGQGDGIGGAIFAIGIDNFLVLSGTGLSDLAVPRTSLFVLPKSPEFVSVDTYRFTVGVPSSFEITASGFPAAVLSESGPLPAGVDFDASTGLLSGTPAPGSSGVYSLTFTASNGVGDNATQSFTLTVDQAPTIISSSYATFTAGAAGSFTAMASGFPSPVFTEAGTLPEGVSFSNGVLSGTPGPGTGGAYPLTLTASNGVATDATQAFILTVNQASAITSGNSAIVTAGTEFTFATTASGFPSSVFTETGALPEGVSFSNGVLSGTPGPGTGGTYSLIFTASNGVGTDATQVFTLIVNQAPAITSGNSATTTAGAVFTFATTAAGFPSPVFTETGTLPEGVSFSDGVLSGTPAPGTGGTYSLIFTASNGVNPDATQAFTFTVNQSPAITSVANATFVGGVAGSFTVTAAGFPTPTLAETGALPAGLSFTNGVLKGTPAAGTRGIYAITFTASNGIGNTVTQSFTLTINQAPAITSAANVTFVVGAAGTFTVAAAGFPTPALAATGALPNGITFNNGVLSGIAAKGSQGSYTLSLTASNGVGSSFTQEFTFLVETPNQVYVRGVYLDLLGRAADASGIDFWANQLEQGTARSLLISLIDHSAEYFATIIKPAYQSYLGRQSDSNGLAFWINQMINGLTDEHLEAGFIGSPEFYQHAGGSDKAWVDAMYKNLLGRQPDTSGEDFWVHQLTNGANRAAVAFGFAASTEREEQRVLADYQKYLGRKAGQAEIDYWVDQFKSHGKTNEDLITGFVSSDEYYQKHSN